MKYQCNKCNKEIELNKIKLVFDEDKKDFINKDVICCEEEMECITNYNGFPTIHRNEYTWEDDIIQSKAKQKEARLKRDGYDKNEFAE